MFYVLIVELRQLRYFLIVSEELHFGRAARRLYMAQPPLSQQIRRLEEELGTPLLQRTSRSVSLTPAGRALQARARDILQAVEEAEQEVRLISSGQQGRLRIGFIPAAMETTFPEALRTFRQENPEVEFSLREMHSTDQLEGLRDGSLDTGLIRLVGRDLAGLHWSLFSSEPYVAALPLGHHLCDRSIISLRDLHREPLVFFYRHQHPLLHDSILARFRACGALPEIVMRVRTANAILALVGAGIGVSLVARQLAQHPCPGIAFIPISDDLPPVVNALVWNPDCANPLTQQFRRCLERFTCLDPTLPDDPAALLRHTSALYAVPSNSLRPARN